MTNALEDRPAMDERYAKATASGNLTPGLKGTTDADILLAAGIAALKDPKVQRQRMLALKLHRMAVNNDLCGLYEVAEAADGWVCNHLIAKKRKPMSRAARQQLIVDTLKWWLQPICGYCGGTGFLQQLVAATGEGSGKLTTHACESCHGSGHRPLQREVPAPLYETAAWMAAQLDRHVADLHNEMAKLLGQRLEL